MPADQPLPAPLKSWQVAALIATLSLVWGYNWVMMKVATHDAPPFAFAALRFLGGAIVLIATFKLMGRDLHWRAMAARWQTVVLVGTFQTACCFGLITWAISTGTAGRAAILNYTMVFWVLVFSAAFLHERVPVAQWAAAGIALIGIGCIVFQGGGSGDLASIGLGLAAGLTWGIGVIITKRAMKFGAIDSMALTAWQMLVGALILCLVALLVPEPPIDWTPAFIAAILYNIGPATPLAYAIWFTLISRLSAGLASLSIMLTPLLGIILSGLQLGERPGLVEGVGMGLILLAIAGLGLVGNRRNGTGRA
jgi:drug/metabolite transporter (DMT)-like permease